MPLIARLSQRQLPGRLEALRQVLRQGFDNANPELVHLAGADKRFKPSECKPLAGVMSLRDPSHDHLQAERDGLPF